MARHALEKMVFLVAALVVVALAGCDNTPTVPIPPPEICSIPNAPDENGFATVRCDFPSARDGDVALVFNDDWGVGVMERFSTNADGEFVVEVEADPADLIIVEIKRDDEVSSQKKVSVPTP